MTHYDYIVIGAGSAGCVVANRLTENPEITVLLLEAGNPATRPEIQIPGKWMSLLGSEVDWGYFTEPDVNGNKIYQPRGKVVGGSSSINAMLYVRGNRHDYDHWQALGNQGWSYKDVLPYFKKSEHQQRGASEFHGANGALSVSDPISPAVTSLRFVEAAEQLGYDRNPDFNGARQEGAGLYQLTIEEGKRHSAAAAFLVPILDRPNLTVQTGAFVTRLLFEGTRTIGVEYLHEARLNQADVNQEVILSAGAFDSPKLLMLSGIGNADELRSLNIPVVADLPGVGQNLQDHIAVSVVHRAIQEVQPALTSSIVEAGMFLHSGDALNQAPDLQFLSGPVLWSPPSYPNEGLGFVGGVCLTHPQSRGRVTLRPVKGSALRSIDPKDSPCIQMNYVQSESDLQKLVFGLRIVRELFGTELFDEFRGEEVPPGRTVTSDEALKDYVRNVVSTVWHPVGTCKMGTDSMAVVDASIMPTITTGNTNAPTIMIGEKAADLIKGARRVPSRFANPIGI